MDLKLKTMITAVHTQLGNCQTRVDSVKRCDTRVVYNG